VAWRRNLPELTRRSLSWTSGHREDAEDALGQAALTALEKMSRDLDSDAERRWLLRLVYSRCMDIHRHRKRSRWVAGDLDAPSLKEKIETAGPGLESELLESELLTVIQGHIESLPPRLRRVAELHLLEEKPYSEIADLLSLAEANVRKRMQEARAHLREPLQTYLAGDVHIQAPRKLTERRRLEHDEPAPLRPSGWSLKYLERYVRHHPRSWKRRWELARRLSETGSLEKAVLHLREAASRQPRRADLWLDLGTTLLRLGRTGEAQEAFEAALRRR
jgi:RNA polymerase sigma-70 factor (ECF subfamily)